MSAGQLGRLISIEEFDRIYAQAETVRVEYESAKAALAAHIKEHGC